MKKHSLPVIFALTLMSASIRGFAQTKEDIHAKMIGRWEWTRTIITPGKTRGPVPDKATSPQTCNCKRRLTITADKIISEKPLTDTLVIFRGKESREGIKKSSDYKLREFAFMNDRVRIIIDSDILQGDVRMTGDSAMSVGENYCGSTYYYFRKIK